MILLETALPQGKCRGYWLGELRKSLGWDRFWDTSSTSSYVSAIEHSAVCQLLFYILAENKHIHTQKWAFQLSNPPFAPSPQPHFEKELWPAAAPPPPAGQPHLSWGASGEKEEQEKYIAGESNSESLAATGSSKWQQIYNRIAEKENTKGFIMTTNKAQTFSLIEML